jgi:hypothetical protein
MYENPFPSPFSASTQRTVQLEPYMQWPLWLYTLFFFFFFFFLKEEKEKKRKRTKEKKTLFISKEGTEATLLLLYFKWLRSNL